MKFVSESFGDHYVVEKGQIFTKKWTFLNDGNQEWPSSLVFTSISSKAGSSKGLADFGKFHHMVKNKVKPNDAYTVMA